MTIAYIRFDIYFSPNERFMIAKTWSSYTISGKVYTSSKAVFIPVTFGNHSTFLRSHVVECDVLLLMSRESLQKAACLINFYLDKVYMFGQEVEVKISKSGHYCVPVIKDDKQETIKNVLLSSPIDSSDDKINEKKIVKLHK